MRLLSIPALGVAAVLAIAAVHIGDANAVPGRGGTAVTTRTAVATSGRHAGMRNARGSIRNARGSVAWRGRSWRGARGAVVCRTVWANGVRSRRCRAAW
jgi:hypothetical protein